MSDEQRRNEVFSQQKQAVDYANKNGLKSETVAEKMMREFGIAMPSEVVTLPSGGVVYPSSSSLHMKNSLMIKAMTTREEDILTTRAFIKKGTVISELIKACVIESEVNVDQLISGDRNALLVAIRCTGYGHVYKPTMECPSCHQQGEQNFDLSKLPIKPLGADPIMPGINEFAFELPKMKAKVTFKLLTGADESDLLAAQSQKKKVLNTSIDSTISDQLKASIVSVNGITDRSKLSFFVDHMAAEDSLALRSYIGDIQPGVDMRQKFECPSCGHEEGGVEIPISLEFLWPNSR